MKEVKAAIPKIWESIQRSTTFPTFFAFAFSPARKRRPMSCVVAPSSTTCWHFLFLWLKKGGEGSEGRSLGFAGVSKGRPEHHFLHLFRLFSSDRPKTSAHTPLRCCPQSRIFPLLFTACKLIKVVKAVKGGEAQTVLHP